MDGVERLTQMNEVERMREVMDVISDNMRKQNDKDRMEMLAMLASTTAMETNLMSGNFARRADTQATGKKTKKNKGKALMKGVEQAENDDNSSLEESKIIEWSTYRQELRDLPSEQSSETSYADITWPSEPA